MWINLGRLLMLLVWCFLIFNVVQPFPRPLKYFFDVALIFMVLMHLLQLLLLKVSITKSEPKFTLAFQVRMFLFGVFEMLAWQKKLRQR
ncbi:DUF1145 family protein [Acerihabitans sp. KWT182]|uniref:DUF1145 family protein n=1 Tax=Acerihabitans sp. KWT182 TaxID=3157919 RepID=A0AAU7Q8V3_9GAMM